MVNVWGAIKKYLVRISNDDFQGKWYPLGRLGLQSLLTVILYFAYCSTKSNLVNFRIGKLFTIERLAYDNLPKHFSFFLAFALRISKILGTYSKCIYQFISVKNFSFFLNKTHRIGWMFLVITVCPGSSCYVHWDITINSMHQSII